jgi:DNA-binding response OmpR family regulator
VAAEKQKRILVVDDEKEVVHALTVILQRSGYETIATTKGREALRLAKELLPDLVILDVVMPDMRGEEIKRLLSEDAETSSIPTIFLTAVLTKEDEKFLKTLTGQVRSLAKPVSSEDLLEAVKAVFS